MVTGLINQYRKTLRVLWGLFLLICAAEFIWLMKFGSISFDQPVYILLVASPFFLFGTVHLALMYGSWFSSVSESGFLTNIRKGIFWFTLVAFIFVVVGFVGRYGLQMW